MALIKCNSVGPSREARLREGPERESDKEFNLEAVGFRTYEESLFEVFKESSHAQFMASLGLTKFLRLSWGQVHREAAVEFLKNYKKKKSPKSDRVNMTSNVRRKKITLTKKLIADAFQLSFTGYKPKKMVSGKVACSSLFDPVTAKGGGYHIRDCKDPAYFERLQALNRLICLKPPGQLISAVMVDMVIRAAIQPVDWASLMRNSLMTELDRVTSSLRQSPCSLVGVHIFMILSNLKIVTFEDRLVLESIPCGQLDEYSAANSITSSTSSSLPVSPRSLKPALKSALKPAVKPAGSRLAELLDLKEGFGTSSRQKSLRFHQIESTLPEIHVSDKEGECLYPLPPGSVQDYGKPHSSLAASVSAYFKKGLRCLQQCSSAP